MTQIDLISPYRKPHQVPSNFSYDQGVDLTKQLKAEKLVIAFATERVEQLSESLVSGLQSQGCRIVNIGITSMEELGFAVRELRAGGGIRVAGSDAAQAVSLLNDKSIELPVAAIPEQQLNASDTAFNAQNQNDNPVTNHNPTTSYIMNLMSVMHCMCKVPLNHLEPLSVVVHHGTDNQWPLLDTLGQTLTQRRIPIRLLKANHLGKNDEDPLKQTASKVATSQADFGIVIDPNTSKCRFINEHGDLVEHDAIAFMLAEMFQSRYPTDPIALKGAMTQNSKQWQSLNNNHITESQLRSLNATYGFCSKQHHYFRHLAFAKSALLPCLLLCIYLSELKCPLSSATTDKLAA